MPNTSHPYIAENLYLSIQHLEIPSNYVNSPVLFIFIDRPLQKPTPSFFHAPPLQITLLKKTNSKRFVIRNDYHGKSTR